ncbi:MAG: DUF4416 family protein [Deltaproteobacteria bacterium]|nr:DUF4416 family protein [Deltaproteobacteria bacterium]
MQPFKNPKPVKFFLSFLYPTGFSYDAFLGQASEKWGPHDLFYADLSFHHTTYYEAEMGKNLLRGIVGFKKMMGRETLKEMKQWAMTCEQRFQKSNGSRVINIDPGYVNDAQLVLATRKNFSHRIYLGEGIFADLTLFYKNGAFQSLPWTYPDYAEQPLKGMIDEMRKDYLRRILCTN